MLQSVVDIVEFRIEFAVFTVFRELKQDFDLSDLGLVLGIVYVHLRLLEVVDQVLLVQMHRVLGEDLARPINSSLEFSFLF